MARNERLIRGGLTSDHIVQLFDTIDSLTDTVSEFLAEGYRNGDYLLVIAKQDRWKKIATLLKERVGSGSRLPAERMTVLDAEATLPAFMRRGLPDSVLFHRTVGEMLSDFAAHHAGRLRIYGEGVDLLAEEGNFHGAQRLEELWNEQAVRHSFVCLCGYAAHHFVPSGARDALADICRAHTHVQKNAADPLAQRLLVGF